MGYTLQPGDIITTLPRLAAETGLTEKEVRTAIMHLKKTGEITEKTTNKFRLITVEKWACYQGGMAPLGRQRAAKGQTKGSQGAAVEEEDKKVNNIRYIQAAPAPVKKNRFLNYRQRNYDYEEWDEMDRKERDSW